MLIAITSLGLLAAALAGVQLMTRKFYLVPIYSGLLLATLLAIGLDLAWYFKQGLDTVARAPAGAMQQALQDACVDPLNSLFFVTLVVGLPATGLAGTATARWAKRQAPSETGVI